MLFPARLRPTRAGVKRRRSGTGWSGIAERSGGEQIRGSRQFALVLLHPRLEFGRGTEAEQIPQVECVVERGALIVQHYVVGAGNSHDEVDACRSEESEQSVHIVLIGF